MKNIQNREEKWRILGEEINRRGGDGCETVSALKNLYSVYSPEMLTWLGSLFDSKIGGFYYSSTAKNGDSYLPDIESTYQAIVLLQRCGVVESYDKIPENIRRKIAGFICSLEDPNTGYFYHPQWSRSLTDSKASRKGRDHMWATALSSWLDFDLPYPNASERAKSLKRGNSNHLASSESLKAYLEGLDFGDRILYSVHRVVSQGDQIIASGLADTALEFFNRLQSESGSLLSGELSLRKILAFYGISGLYKAVFKTKMPAGRKIADAILSHYLCAGADFDVKSVPHIRNVWGTLSNIIDNLKEFGSDDDRNYAKELSLRLLAQAPAAISFTAEKISAFKKASGAFALNIEFSPTTSGGVPVAPENTADGDVNATTIAVGMISSIFRSLGLAEYKVPLFEPENFEKFILETRKN